MEDMTAEKNGQIFQVHLRQNEQHTHKWTFHNCLLQHSKQNVIQYEGSEKKKPIYGAKLAVLIATFFFKMFIIWNRTITCDHYG